MTQLPGIYLEVTITEKDTCTSMFTAALFTILEHGNNLSTDK